MNKRPGPGNLSILKRLSKFCFITSALSAVFLWLPLSLHAQQIKEDDMEKYVGSQKLEVVDEVSGARFPLFLMYPTSVPSKTVKIGPFSIILAYLLEA